MSAPVWLSAACSAATVMAGNSGGTRVNGSGRAGGAISSVAGGDEHKDDTDEACVVAWLRTLPDPPLTDPDPLDALLGHSTRRDGAQAGAGNGSCACCCGGDALMSVLGLGFGVGLGV